MTLTYLLAPWLLQPVQPILGTAAAGLSISAVLARYRMGDTFGNHLVQFVVLLSSALCIAVSLAPHR